MPEGHLSPPAALEDHRPIAALDVCGMIMAERLHHLLRHITAWSVAQTTPFMILGDLVSSAVRIILKEYVLT